MLHRLHVHRCKCAHVGRTGALDGYRAVSLVQQGSVRGLVVEGLLDLHGLVPRVLLGAELLLILALNHLVRVLLEESAHAVPASFWALCWRLLGSHQQQIPLYLARAQGDLLAVLRELVLHRVVGHGEDRPVVGGGGLVLRCLRLQSDVVRGPGILRGLRKDVMRGIFSAANAVHLLRVQLELHEVVALGRDVHLVVRGQLRVESLRQPVGSVQAEADGEGSVVAVVGDRVDVSGAERGGSVVAHRVVLRVIVALPCLVLHLRGGGGQVPEPRLVHLRLLLRLDLLVDLQSCERLVAHPVVVELEQVVLVHFVRDGLSLGIEHEHPEGGSLEPLALNFADAHLRDALELVDDVVAPQKVQGVLHQPRLIVVRPERLHLFLVDRVLLPRLHHLVQQRELQHDLGAGSFLAPIVLGQPQREESPLAGFLDLVLVQPHQRVLERLFSERL